MPWSLLVAVVGIVVAAGLACFETAGVVATQLHVNPALRASYLPLLFLIFLLYCHALIHHINHACLTPPPFNIARSGKVTCLVAAFERYLPTAGIKLNEDFPCSMRWHLQKVSRRFASIAFLTPE